MKPNFLDALAENPEKATRAAGYDPSKVWPIDPARAEFLADIGKDVIAKHSHEAEFDVFLTMAVDGSLAPEIAAYLIEHMDEWRTRSAAWLKHSSHATTIGSWNALHDMADRT